MDDSQKEEIQSNTEDNNNFDKLIEAIKEVSSGNNNIDLNPSEEINQMDGVWMKKEEEENIHLLLKNI